VADPKALILALTGATATGKTAAALALADRLPVSIISMDSAMVYRGLDIGTAKPSAQVLAEYPHALIDIRDPAEPYSAADFVRDADAAIASALAAGRIPLLVGGTMLYLRAFREGLAPMPSADPEIRAGIAEDAKRLGWEVLHQELERVDPAAARGIHPHNTVRIERALEVYRQTGRPMSEFWAQAKSQPARMRHQARLREFALMPASRAELHQRIAQRVDQMLDAGLIEEVGRLHQRGDLHLSLPAIRAVGYRQVWEHLEGHSDFAQMRERIIFATRQLAKRQLTWLRGWSVEELPWAQAQHTAQTLARAAAAAG
jgi:tRNA dimethylallyltransferase